MSITTKDQALATAQDRLHAALTAVPGEIITAILQAVIGLLGQFCPAKPPTPTTMLEFSKAQLAALHSSRLTSGRLRVRAAIREATGYRLLDPRITEAEAAVWTVSSNSTVEELTALSSVWSSSNNPETGD